jgi:hypothetical protein
VSPERKKKEEMMKTQRRVVHTLAALSVAALAAVWAVAPAYAIHDSETALFGPVGLTRGQMVRLSVYAVGKPTDVPWDFVVRIFNVRGEKVREIRLQQAPGSTGLADVAVTDPEDFPPDAFGRRTLRAEIVGFNPQPDPPGDWFATLEVFGARTGRTSVLLGGPDTIPNPTR